MCIDVYKRQRLDRAIEKVMQHAKPVTDSKATIERIPVEKGGRDVYKRQSLS